MPLKLRQRGSQREVSVYTENSQAESAVNGQGQDSPQPPPTANKFDAEADTGLAVDSR